MHHGQSRGGKKRKVCKKLLNFRKRGGEILEKRGKLKIFANQEGKCSKTGKIGGKSEIFGE